MRVQNWLLTLVVALLRTAGSSHAATIFSDNFESGNHEQLDDHGCRS